MSVPVEDDLARQLKMVSLTIQVGHEDLHVGNQPNKITFNSELSLIAQYIAII